MLRHCCAADTAAIPQHAVSIAPTLSKAWQHAACRLPRVLRISSVSGTFPGAVLVRSAVCPGVSGSEVSPMTGLLCFRRIMRS